MTVRDDSHIQETHFFRAPRQYEWIAERLPKKGSLKVWSAGCSSGAELYSLLIMLAEAHLLGGALQIELLGTDRDSEAIARARTGRFTEWELRGLSPERRKRYFHEGALSEDLLKHVRFEVGDLLSDPAPSQCDLILCRNVLIYYRPVQVLHILATLGHSLTEEGTLLLGYAEAPQALTCPELALRDGPAAAFYRRQDVEVPTVTELPPPAAPMASDPAPAGSTVAALPQSRLRKALLCLDRGQTRLALEELRRLLYAERRHAAGHYYLGLVWRIEGQPERARRHFRTALEQLEKLPSEDPLDDLDLTAGDLAILARGQLGWIA